MKGSKCVVHDCTNHKDEGVFVGDFCAPCWRMITTGRIGPSDNFIAKLNNRFRGLLIVARSHSQTMIEFLKKEGAL